MLTIGGGRIYDINVEGKWTDIKNYINNFLLTKEDCEIIKEIINYRNKNVFDQDTLSKHIGLSKKLLKKYLNCPSLKRINFSNPN